MPLLRVVSLVPSITEALAGVEPGAVVGATDWCTHPPDLDAYGVQRVRGTKNPDLRAIVALRPDVVVANREENRELDVRRLRDAGVRVWVSQIESLADAFRAYDELFGEVLGWSRPGWLDQAIELWGGAPPPVERSAVIPIWRDPWMVVGARTFAGDLLRHLGVRNLFADDAERYPHVDLAELDAAGADLAVLPDEPYAFSADDGPEAFTRTPTRLVSGRLLTWYGPSLVEAHEVLSDALA
jgi:ABC-type Fe3+-hydroxamate transport system substrate-binding protein